VPLAATGELVTRAAAAHSAVAAFNIITLEHVEAVIAGAEAADAPVVLQVSENAVRFRHGRLHPLARAAAVAADGRRGRGEDAPLLGLPMTLKESINVAGLRTTAGMPQWAQFRSEHDAPVTVRTRRAGAVLMAKTNVPPMLADWQSANAVYGRTNNPYDLARTPGGSSGGEAAIIAAGGSPCGLGTDSGGSVRLPAHFCGLASIKPSAARVPLTGVLDDEGELGTPVPAHPSRTAGPVGRGRRAAPGADRRTGRARRRGGPGAARRPG
jgi:Asp-tRNA(Asn)/Glu-tRNA(Gln) amidotransferase A subunit family amidase